MTARLESRKRDAEADNLRIYNAAALNGISYAGKLKPYRHYFGGKDSDKSRGGLAVLGALMAMQKKGVRMQIERIKR